MYQKRHHGSIGPKPYSNIHQLGDRDQQSKVQNSYTQLQFENSLGKVQVCKQYGIIFDTVGHS